MSGSPGPRPAAARGGAGAAAGRRSRAARGRGRRGGSRGRRGGAAAPAVRPSAAASTSSRVMRPPTPVPVIVAGSRPCSAMRRRTTGDSSGCRRRRARRGPGCGAGAGGRAPAGAAPGRAPAPAARSAAGSLGGRGLGGRAPRRPAAPRRAASAAGASAAGAAAGGRVAVADHGQHGADVDGVALGHQDLGERSRRPARAPRSRPCRWTPRTAARPRRPVSPTSLNHLVIVPSVTVSPSWGIVMSAMCLPDVRSGLAVQRAAGEAEHGLAEAPRSAWGGAG